VHVHATTLRPDLGRRLVQRDDRERAERGRDSRPDRHGDRTYQQLERGYYLHDAEHGAVIFLYNCPAGCPDVVSALEDVVRAMPTDPGCVAPVRQRALVTGDPLLPDGVTVAAVAWDNLYTASCVDSYLGTFASNHYAFGPEKVTDDGENLGGTFIDVP
jgi:hypothetical protein